MIELLSPVGDFDCLKSAVQNGADAVYFGANSFSARAFASNFDDNTLEQAINYAKIRGVKTNLTLNTLIKNNEMESAINLAKKAYEYGIDAIIVQDLGLAKYLIKNFPDLAVHASTQMSVHNLDGVIALQNMGFSRVVLSREFVKTQKLKLKFLCMVHYVFLILVNAYFLVWLAVALEIVVNVHNLADFHMNYWKMIKLLTKAIF